MWETFEHTADIGLRVRAEDLPSLFAEAARGMLSIAVENPVAVLPAVPVSIELEADQLEDLMVDWLSEVLGVLDQRHLVLSRFGVTISGRRLVASAAGATLDPARHMPGQEIKAVTYHALKVEKTAAGWMAEVVLDI